MHSAMMLRAEFPVHRNKTFFGRSDITRRSTQEIDIGAGQHAPSDG